MASRSAQISFEAVKGNALVVGMAFLLAMISLLIAWYAFEYIQLTRSLNRAQFTATQVELRQNRLKALVAESVEYSQRNPAINPLLIAIGAKSTQTAPTTPAARPQSSGR